MKENAKFPIHIKTMIMTSIIFLILGICGFIFGFLDVFYSICSMLIFFTLFCTAIAMQKDWQNFLEENDVKTEDNVKIIEDEKPKQMTCPTCHCVFEYKQSYVEHLSGMTCLNKGTDIVRCPSCNEMINIVTELAVNSLGHLK